jgi:hypothetical protein
MLGHGFASMNNIHFEQLHLTFSGVSDDKGNLHSIRTIGISFTLWL